MRWPLSFVAIVLLLAANAPDAAHAQNARHAKAQPVRVVGCPRAPVRICRSLTGDDGVTYNIGAAAPAPDPKRHRAIILTGRKINRLSACPGVYLEDIHWTYISRRCP